MNNFFPRPILLKSIYSVVIDTLHNFPIATFINVLVIILATLVEVIGIGLLLPSLEVLLKENTSDLSGFSRKILDIFNFFGISFQIKNFLIVFAGLITLKYLFLAFSNWQINRVRCDMISLSRKNLLNRLINTKLNLISSLSLGSLINSIIKEAEAIGNAYSLTCLLIVSALNCLMVLALSFLVSWQISLIAIFLGVAITVILKNFIYLTKKLGKKDTLIHSEFHKKFVEIMNSLKHLKVAGESTKIKKILFNKVESINFNSKRFVLFHENIICFQNIFFTFALLIGIYLLLEEFLFPLEKIAVLSIIFIRLTQSIGKLQKHTNNLAQIEAPYKRITKLNNLLKENQEKKGIEIKNILKSIELKNISFSYGKKEILKNFSFKVKVGQTILIKGLSGSGKTTLVDLISGLLEPSSGEIKIDNKRIIPLGIKFKKNLIGYVPQDYFLFNDTILNNLISSNIKNINYSKINDSLKLAEAYDFVSNLKNGLKTIIGEKGAKLSGGQRQRIAIASIFLKQPKILILDEATSALDEETENKILRNIKRNNKKFAVIIISHRSKIAKFADCVINLNSK